MDLMVKILEREGSNSGLIYIYRENEKWVAYDRSALYLSKMIKNLLLACHVVEGAFWMPKAEVDMEVVPKEYILCASNSECVLKYNPVE